METIYEKLAEILEVDEVNESEILEEFESWDSLTSLSIIALADSDYGISLSAEKLKSLQTIGDLINHLNHK